MKSSAYTGDGRYFFNQSVELSQKLTHFGGDLVFNQSRKGVEFAGESGKSGAGTFKLGYGTFCARGVSDSA